MKKNDWKDRLNVVFSTNPNYSYETDEENNEETLTASEQNLRVKLDKKNRGGKVVTLVTNFVGSEDECKELGKLLKRKCGVGGSVKENEIIIQGDFKKRIIELLIENGYKRTKGSGG